MPSFSSVALFSLAVIGAAAAPTPGGWYGHHGQCLNDDQAQQIADTWGALIQNYSDELADATLTQNFTDYSESVNTLINSCPQGDAAIALPLLAPTFSSLEQFKRGQGQQPPINFQLLNLWHSCTTVNLRWMTTNTANITDVKPVVGLIALETVKNTNPDAQYPWLIDTVYSEFDAGAWLQNLVEAGICKTDAGIPSDNTGSGSGSGASSAVVSSSTVVDATAPTSTWAASSTWAAATTTSCSDSWETSTTTWAAASTYA